jgi:hypothetical protein
VVTVTQLTQTILAFSSAAASEIIANSAFPTRFVPVSGYGGFYQPLTVTNNGITGQVGNVYLGGGIFTIATGVGNNNFTAGQPCGWGYFSVTYSIS